MTTDDPTDGFTGSFHLNETPWYPFTISIPPDVTIILHADGKWEGSIEALRDALAKGKSWGDGTTRVLLWLILRQMEQHTRRW